MDAVDRTATRIEQSQVIVDFSCGGNSGARVARRVLLLDGDGRSQAVNFVHVWLFNALEELARIGRERFDVPTLPFCVDGVEGERTLAGSGDTTDDSQFAVRNIAGYVLQIVGPRSAD